MSKQLILSAALSILMMGGFALSQINSAALPDKPGLVDGRLPAPTVSLSF